MRGSALLVRLALAAILGVAAYTKFRDPAEVVATMNRSALFPTSWDHATAYAMIAVETLLALALLSRRTASVGLMGYAALSSAFFGYSLWRGWQDIKAPCGCFGLLLRLEPWQGALLSTLMCVASLLALRSLLADPSARSFNKETAPLGENP